MLTKLQSLGISRSGYFASGVLAFPLKYQLGWTSSCLEQLMWKRMETRGAGAAILKFLVLAQPLWLASGVGAELDQAGLKDSSAVR